MCKISVIVPTYNVEEYLEQALDSLVDQTIFSDLEVIIINDGSTDNSPIIAKHYADKYTNIRLFTQENAGYGVAMNTGLSLANGEYIGILEPDDFLAIQMYEDLYNLASKHGHTIPIVKATSIYKVLLKNGKEIDNVSKYNTIDSNLILNTSDYILSSNYVNNSLYQAMPAIWSAIYKRSFIEINKIKFNTIKDGYQDLPFYIETVFCASKIAFIDTPYYYYRVAREGSSSKAKTNKGFILFDIHLFTEERLKHHNIEKAKSIMNNVVIRFYTSLLWGYTSLTTEDKKVEYLEQVKNYIIGYSNRNKELFNLKVFNNFREAQDKQYNDVELLITKGAKYLNSKLAPIGKKNMLLILKIVKQPLFLIITIIKLVVNITKQIFILTLRINNGSK